MSATAAAVLSRHIPHALHRRWGWLLTLAAVQIAGGLAAIAVPPLASLIAIAAFGFLMVVSGAAQIVHATRVRQWQGWALSLISGVLYVVAGVLALSFPLPGMLAVTLCLGALFVVDAGVRMSLAWKVRDHEGWGWFLASGIASLMLGVALLVGWPAIALWAIGLLLGINLVVAGVSNAVIALMCRKRCRESGPDGHSSHHASVAV